MKITLQKTFCFKPVAGDRPWLYLSVALLLGALVTNLLLFSDYGITWDEELQHTYGEHVFNYYRTLFQDTSALNYVNLYLYGGLFDGTVSWACRFSNLDDYETRHLLNALTGWMGLLATWLLAHRIAGSKTAFLSTLLLLLTPTYFGHQFNNPKDIPFAAGYAWTLYFIIRFIAELPRVRFSTGALTGLVLGMTLGIRVGGLLLFGYLAAALALFFALSAMQPFLAPLLNDEIPAQCFRDMIRRNWIRITLSLLILVCTAYAVMLAAWPWAQRQPFSRPFEALEQLAHFNQWNRNILFAGQNIPCTELPWYYLPHYIGIRMPLFTLGALVLGIATGINCAVKRKVSARQMVMWLVVFAAFLFPPVYVILKKSVLYDGIRHFIFIIPPLCVIAGAELASLYNLVDQKLRHGKTVLSILLCLLLLPQTYALFALHPYQYTYFNKTIGGLQNACKRYDTDYWCSSFREATLWLLDYAKTQPAAGKPQKVFVSGCAHAVNYYLNEEVQFTRELFQADYFIGTTRWQLDTGIPGEVLYTVQRQNAPFARVKDLRDISWE